MGQEIHLLLSESDLPVIVSKLFSPTESSSLGESVNENHVGSLAGVVFGLTALPLLHLSVVDFENKTATDSDFVAHIADRYIPISIASGVGLLLVGVLLLHISWLKGLLSRHTTFGAKVAQNCALITASAMAIGFGFSIVTAYGAHEKFPDLSVRTVAMIAENLGTSLMIGLAAFAGLIALLGWRKKFPLWLTLIATIEVLITLVVTIGGVPAAAAIVTIVWVLANSIGMAREVRK